MQENLLILRTKKKMTKTEVAKYLGMSTKTYSAKEKGEYEFTSDEMFKLRDLFNENLENIFLPRNHQFGDKKEGDTCNG